MDEKGTLDPESIRDYGNSPPENSALTRVAIRDKFIDEGVYKGFDSDRIKNAGSVDTGEKLGVVTNQFDQGTEKELKAYCACVEKHIMADEKTPDFEKLTQENEVPVNDDEKKQENDTDFISLINKTTAGAYGRIDKDKEVSISKEKLQQLKKESENEARVGRGDAKEIYERKVEDYHVHLHMLVLGGGLGDDHCWHEQGDGFFLPVGAISGLLRGKFLSGLKELRKQGRLVYAGQAEKHRNHYEYQALLDTCYEKNWVSFCKESFAGAGSVLEYIGRYTHRIAISNSRILAMDDKNVTFRVKDRKSGTWKETTITGVEFIRRFLMHVLPKRFVKIRHYGLWSNRNKKTLLTVCRNLIGCRVYLSRLKDLDSSGILKELYGIDVNTCPCCGGSLQNRRDCHSRERLLYVT